MMILFFFTNLILILIPLPLQLILLFVSLLTVYFFFFGSSCSMHLIQNHLVNWIMELKMFSMDNLKWMLCQIGILTTTITKLSGCTFVFSTSIMIVSNVLNWCCGGFFFCFQMLRHWMPVFLLGKKKCAGLLTKQTKREKMFQKCLH